MLYTTLLISLSKIKGTDIEFSDLCEIFPLPSEMEDLGMIDDFIKDENETLDDILKYHGKIDSEPSFKTKKRSLGKIKNSICKKLYPNFTVDTDIIKNMFDPSDRNNFKVYKTWLDILKFLNHGTIFLTQNSESEICEFQDEFTKIFDYKVDNQKFAIFRGKPRKAFLEKINSFLSILSKKFNYAYDTGNLIKIQREINKILNLKKKSVGCHSEDLILVIVDWIRNIDDNFNRIVLMFILINNLVCYKDDKLCKHLISLMIHIFLYYRCDKEIINAQKSSPLFYIDRLRLLLKTVNASAIYKCSENKWINGKSLREIINKYHKGDKHTEGKNVFFYCLIISTLSQFKNRARVYIDFLVCYKSQLVQQEYKKVFKAIIQHLIQILDGLDFLKPQ